jgi:hypothetical protein
MFEDDEFYHASGHLVYVDPDWVFEESHIWDVVDDAEAAGVSLAHIGEALRRDRDLTLMALVNHDTGAVIEIAVGAERQR